VSGNARHAKPVCVTNYFCNELLWQLGQRRGVGNQQHRRAEKAVGGRRLVVAANTG
jgi:hypothetical protein